MLERPFLTRLERACGYIYTRRSKRHSALEKHCKRLETEQIVAAGVCRQHPIRQNLARLRPRQSGVERVDSAGDAVSRRTRGADRVRKGATAGRADSS